MANIKDVQKKIGKRSREKDLSKLVSKLKKKFNSKTLVKTFVDDKKSKGSISIPKLKPNSLITVQPPVVIDLTTPPGSPQVIDLTTPPVSPSASDIQIWSEDEMSPILLPAPQSPPPSDIQIWSEDELSPLLLPPGPPLPAGPPPFRPQQFIWGDAKDFEDFSEQVKQNSNLETCEVKRAPNGELYPSPLNCQPRAFRRANGEIVHFRKNGEPYEVKEAVFSMPRTPNPRTFLTIKIMLPTREDLKSIINISQRSNSDVYSYWKYRQNRSDFLPSILSTFFKPGSNFIEVQKHHDTGSWGGVGLKLSEWQILLTDEITNPTFNFNGDVMAHNVFHIGPENVSDLYQNTTQVDKIYLPIEYQLESGRYLKIISEIYLFPNDTAVHSSVVGNATLSKISKYYKVQWKW